MIRHYSGGGSDRIDLDGPMTLHQHWAGPRATDVRLLYAHGQVQAADSLQTAPFYFLNRRNGFSDELDLLYDDAPMEAYVEFGALVADRVRCDEDAAKAVGQIIPMITRTWRPPTHCSSRLQMPSGSPLHYTNAEVR